MEEKVCSVCKKSKSAGEYYKHGSDKTTIKLRNDCKQCVLNRHRERKFGVDHKTYKQMLSDQDNRCAICAIHVNDYSERYNNFAVDHCHKTHKVRGLLCHNCNRALGMFQDDMNILKVAVNYLSFHMNKI